MDSAANIPMNILQKLEKVENYKLLLMVLEVSLSAHYIHLVLVNYVVF